MTALALALRDRPTKRPRRTSAPLVLLGLVLLLAAAPRLALAGQGLAADEPSPATGHAQVVAQGVAVLPAAELAWRVVLDTAEVPERAVVEERALGFALADRGALLVADDGSAAEVRLAPGEAAFVPADSRQRRSSLDGADAPYYRLALVPADAAGDAGGDRLVFAGDPFPAPTGRAFDLDLVRDVLSRNEETTLPDTGSQTLVLATAGTVELEASETGSLPVRLAAGQAAAVAGGLSLFGVGERGGAFVAATIGPELPAFPSSAPAPPTPVPAPTIPASGSITLRVLGCPATVDPDDIAAGAADADCAPVALDPAPTLILAGDQPLSPDQLDRSVGTYTWTSLISGPFPLGRPTLPRGYDRSLFVTGEGTVVDPPVFDVGAAPFTVSATLYLFRTETAPLRLGFFACPAGVDRETVSGDVCEPSSGDFAVEIASLDGTVRVGRADAGEPSGAFLTWPALPPGRYAVRVTDLPSGYTEVVIPGATYDAAAGAYLVDAGGEPPVADLAVYFLQAAPNVPGSITVQVYACPPGMSRGNLAGEDCAAAEAFDLRLSLPDGRLLTLAEAEVAGNAATWSGLAPGDYVVEETSLPPGFADAYAPAAQVVEGSAAFVVTVEPGVETAELAIYNLRPDGTAREPTPATEAGAIDTDGDGLADAAELDLGTDPDNQDTDADGRADGDEVGPRRVVTDPLDPDSDDDGVTDGDEIAMGTDPNDQASQ